MTRLILSILSIILLTACAPAQMVASPTRPASPPRAPATPSPITDVVVTPVPYNPYAPQAADSALQRGGAMLESQQIVAKEGLLFWHTLLLKGTLPTPCHRLRVSISPPDARNVIAVQVYSVFAPQQFCIAVIEPFEAAIRLDGYVPGKHTVLVNGAAAGESATPASRSLKGYELYGWQDGGSWQFSLLPGTNRNKTVAEVTAPATRLAGVAALKNQLKQLAPGEWVIVSTLPGLSLPPEPIVADIRAYCAERGLQFSAATP